VGLLDRAPRAAASALLLATAIGAAGTTGISPVLAVDPATVPLSGSLVDEHGTALAGVHLVISEEQPPDGGLAGASVMTAADGSFSASMYPWGTAEAPATLTIKTPPGEQIERIGASCSQTIGVAVSDTESLTLDGATDGPPAIALTASTTLLGEVCGTTGTPAPNSGGSSGSGSGGGSATVTPPPTDGLAAAFATSEERLGPALFVGFLAGLAAAISLSVPRPRSRRAR
jgi:hypothetical protein